MPPARDCFVVDTEPLAGLVGAFVSRWERTRPPAGRPGGPKPNSALMPVGAVRWLANETLLAAHESGGVGVPPRTIEKMLQPEKRSKFTELRIADALLAALDAPEAFHDGTFGEDASNPDHPVKRNPRVDQSCCGGSTTLNGSASPRKH